MIKAVLFDLDGTLVNSLGDLATGVNEALKAYGFLPHKTEEFNYFVGDGIPTMVKRALPEEARSLETVSEVTQKFLEYYGIHFADKTVPYDGMCELIRTLKQRNIKVGVVTNKADEMAKKVISKVFGNVFDEICGLKEPFKPKPHPALALSCIEKLGVIPDDCLFVGDSGMDMAVAKNSGTVPVGALWGFRSKEELTEYGAAYLIEKPLDLLGIIGD